MPPEARIILYAVFVICVFFIKDLTLCWAVIGLLVIPLFLVPFSVLKKGWGPISLLLAFTFISNILFQNGRVLFQAGPFIITDEGLNAASLRTMRLFFMIAGAKILTATTVPGSLVGGLSRLLSPFTRLGIPVDEFLQIVGLAMKSLPHVREEIVSRYMEKLACGPGRGPLGRLRMISSQLVPVFISSMRAPERYFEESSEGGDGPCRCGADQKADKKADKKG